MLGLIGFSIWALSLISFQPGCLILGNVREIEFDEEISNFDEIHRELMSRKRNEPFINSPDRFSDVLIVETPPLITKNRHKRASSGSSSSATAADNINSGLAGSGPSGSGPGSSGDSNNNYNEQRQMQHRMQMSAYGNFDIKTNTIIRTQDSRAMGAEYLNETEKASNNDCLLWCLETVKCNVAVFAETNGNSCYLFDCGTPASFRCQFTTHGYYTSSILKMPANKPFDYVQWKSQVKHESELASLRQTPPSSAPPAALGTTAPSGGGAGNIPSGEAIKDSPPPTTVASAPQTAPQADNKNRLQQDLSSPGCKHYQFQCRQSKECIAIYNVCDGIPQCPDQSDEAQDLHCPQNPALPGLLEQELMKTTPPSALNYYPSTLSPSLLLSQQQQQHEQQPSRNKHHKDQPEPMIQRLDTELRIMNNNNNPLNHNRMQLASLQEDAGSGIMGGLGEGSNANNNDRMIMMMEPQNNNQEPILYPSKMMSKMASLGASEAEENLSAMGKDGRGMMAGGQGSASSASSWNNGNYPSRGEMRDADYGPPSSRGDTGSGGHYPPPLPHNNHASFSNKHSSFMAASNPYSRQQLPPSGNYPPGGQWSEYYANGGGGGADNLLYDPSSSSGGGGGRLPPPPSAVDLGGSSRGSSSSSSGGASLSSSGDGDYNANGRYESGYHRLNAGQSNYENNNNFRPLEASGEASSAGGGGPGPGPLGSRGQMMMDRYRGAAGEGYGPPASSAAVNEQQMMQRGSYNLKSDDGQMVPDNMNPNLKDLSPSSYVSRYSDSSVNNNNNNNRPNSKLYQQQLNEHSQLHYPETQMNHFPPYLQSVNDISAASANHHHHHHSAHDHDSLVVQPQVQNDEEPEDAIYEPLAESPARLRKTGNHPFASKLLVSSTSFPSTSISKLSGGATEKTANASSLKLNSSSPSSSLGGAGGGIVSSMGGAILHNATNNNKRPSFAKISSVSAETSGMTIAELQQATRVHAHESNSAVLALTLGLCVTALLLVSVGCRLRNLRRQVGRKGGRSSLAHDADYLVNGMYL